MSCKHTTHLLWLFPDFTIVFNFSCQVILYKFKNVANILTSFNTKQQLHFLLNTEVASHLRDFCQMFSLIMTVGEISVYWEFLTFLAIDTKYVPLKLMYPAKNIPSEGKSVFISKCVCNKRGPPQLPAQIRSLEMFPSPQGWTKCRKTKPYQLIYSWHILWWISSSKVKNWI